MRSFSDHEDVDESLIRDLRPGDLVNVHGVIALVLARGPSKHDPKGGTALGYVWPHVVVGPDVACNYASLSPTDLFARVK